MLIADAIDYGAWVGEIVEKQHIHLYRPSMTRNFSSPWWFLVSLRDLIDENGSRNRHYSKKKLLEKQSHAEKCHPNGDLYRNGYHFKPLDFVPLTIICCNETNFVIPTHGLSWVGLIRSFIVFRKQYLHSVLPPIRFEHAYTL